MIKALHRDTSRKLIAGVIAGIQREFLPHIDLTLLRVIVGCATVFITPLTPFLVGLYILLWILTPIPGGQPLK